MQDNNSETVELLLFEIKINILIKYSNYSSIRYVLILLTLRRNTKLENDDLMKVFQMKN